MSKLTSSQRKACSARRAEQGVREDAIAMRQSFENISPAHKNKVGMDQAKHKAQEVRKCATRSAVMVIEQKAKHHKMRSFSFDTLSL